MHDHAGHSKNVLIADDDDLIRGVLEDALSGAGYRPIAVEDGLQALDWLGRVPVDLIILDILMPRLDGPALIKRVRQTSRWAAIPILILSAYANLDRFGDLPVDGVLLKPFHLTDLLEKIQRLIGPSGA
jgi:CheY-like chemotaxis protein